MSTTVNKKVVFIGDSNTEGYGLEPHEAYPSIIGALLKSDVLCYNYGVSGACVIKEKIEGSWVGMPYLNTHAYSQACAQVGDVYVINLGTNDATDGAPDEPSGTIDPYGNLMAFKHRFKACYEEIIKGVTSNRPDAAIILCLPIPIGKSIWKKHKEIYLIDLRILINEIADAHGFHIIDLQRAFSEQDDQETYYLEDGLHLNAKGAKAIADLITPDLKRLLLKQNAQKYL